MSTNSYIGVECSDGIRAVYCHWDGYLDGVGEILKDHYTDYLKVIELISGGNISSLRTEIGAKQDFDHPKDDWTVYYGRDRGEEDCEYEVFPNESNFAAGAENRGAEYTYLFKKGKWYYKQPGDESFKEF